MDRLRDYEEDAPEPIYFHIDLEDMDIEAIEGDCQGAEYLFDEEFLQIQKASDECKDVVEVGPSPQSWEGAEGAEGGNEDVDVLAMNEELSVHPLLIPNVIEEVFKYLSAKDIETFRLVSRVWNAEACTVLRSKRTVVFIDPDAVRVYNKAMRNTTMFPHAQFEFCVPDITGYLDEDLREFWQKFGTRIKCLEFRQTHLFWRDFLEVLENNVPNLEKLTLKYLPRNVSHAPLVRTERHQIRSVKILRLVSLPTSTYNATERLTDLLKAFPQLEVIEFLPIKQLSTKTKVSNILMDVLRKPEVMLPNLRRINLNLEAQTEGLDGIASKRFQLQRLHITLANGVKASSFKNLISSLRTSLLELKVSFPENYTNYQTFLNQNKSMHPDECVQLLSNLKSLRMVNFKGSINFVQNLTELEYLEFTTNDLSKAIPFGFKQMGTGFTRYSQDHQLKELKIVSSSTGCPKLAETLMLDSIGRCFPLLNCLYVDGIDDDGLGVIYRNLPFLSDVTLHDAKCTDQGLTGIPLEICNDMLETSTFIIVQAEKYRRDLFIGSLQFLRKLTIVAPQISDASVALGLVDCKNMRELKFGSSLISDTGIIFITDRFCKQLDLLDVTECTEITEQSKFYAREKLTGKLKVADASQDVSGLPKPPGKKEEPAIPSNPDRGIVITKPKAQLLGLSSVTSKFLVQDLEFFEEVSENEVRAGGALVPVVLPMLPPFHPDRRNRYRIMRIREALRRNGDFMRAIERLGAQQFRRLFPVELQQGRNPERPIVLDPYQDGPVAEFRNIHRAEMAAALNGPVPAALPNRNIEEDDGGPAPDPVLGGGDGVLNRLPEIHIAEIYRLGLRPEDIEFWLLNRPLVEREENGNGNVVGAWRMFRGGGAFDFFQDDLDGPVPVDAPPPPRDADLIDMEAIRQVVMNAFDEEGYQRLEG